MSSIKCDLKELQYLPVSDAACIVLEKVHILETLYIPNEMRVPQTFTSEEHLLSFL